MKTFREIAEMHYKNEPNNEYDKQYRINRINALEKLLTEQCNIAVVSNSSGFKEDDLSKAYQAGALETYAEEIRPLTYDAIKQIEQNSLEWIKRWKE